MHTDFRLEVSVENHGVIVAVFGELDLASSQELDDELERIGKVDAELVVVDLREVQFMDSTGVSVLVKAERRARQRTQRFVVVNGRRQVQRLLSLTGLAERLSVVEALEDVLDTA